VEARHILVSGIVQGVGYRIFTERAARELGLAGWVRNLHDGRVEIVAEGASEQLDRFVEKCRRGPRSAEVSEVAVTTMKAQSMVAFTMRPTGSEPEEL